MPTVRTLALVIRSTEVFETSKVLTVFSRELGKVSAIAKGARRLKSPFHSALDLLSVCDMVLIHKGTDALDLVTEATLEERFDALKTDLEALYAGYYVAELLDGLTEHHVPHPKLFEAARVTLRHLADSRLRRHRVLRFELALLRELGHAPALENCVHCGRPIAPRDVQGNGEETNVAFGLSIGGVICAGCRPGQPHVAVLDGGTLTALRALAAPGGEWRNLDLSPESGRFGPLRGTVSAIISHLMGRRPHLLPYLGA
ncbi:DNA repair protein RecO [Isosphaera pallida ATCC 43644]|jgi:DNA repair protein RecO (recombination protein O)|uniref:DNA repair protein RecO n=1 Tax=Isosphaera pallida (strain ATCC 43644 / DSM 9630 / IS1B) TaxID=575540 RepID=E8QXT4_ISOPI|nr:DNA repair protein RecO [Isosphaera pallida]ADV64121.1 DNA repair protein RecO [Isosphaera pallida ATCC 43644]